MTGVMKNVTDGARRKLFIVGERINTSRKPIDKAVRARDVAYLQREAVEQVKAGAQMVDVNAGTFLEEEPEVLTWLVRTVQEAVDAPLCIDSPNPAAIRAALQEHRGQALINSITGEKARFDELLPIVKDHGCSVVALCLDDAGMPSTAQQAVDKGSRLVDALLEAGIPDASILVDPLVRPVSTDPAAGVAVLQTIRAIEEKYPGVGTICGLSNVSFGLPLRRLLNQTFLIACLAAGLDAAIMDPLDDRLMALLRAAEALLGRDEYCTGYIRAYREGKLGQ